MPDLERAKNTIKRVGQTMDHGKRSVQHTLSAIAHVDAAFTQEETHGLQRVGHLAQAVVHGIEAASSIGDLIDTFRRGRTVRGNHEPGRLD